MFQALKKCGIDGKEYEDGDQIPDEAIPAGSLPSALAQGLVVKLPDPPATDAPVDASPKKSK